jgi:hypothetical protein
MTPDPLETALRLREGDRGPAHALLAPWRFATDPVLTDRVLGALVEEPPALPPAKPGDAPRDPLARGLALLHAIGSRAAEDRRRAAAVVWHERSERDRVTAEMWRRWARRDWPSGDTWSRYFGAAIEESFLHAVRAAKVPLERHPQLRDDIRETLYCEMLGGGEDLPNWSVVAARVLETDTGGPLAALARVVGDWQPVAHCIATRGHWPRTVARLPRTEHAGNFGARLDPLLDAHVALRIVTCAARRPLSRERAERIRHQNEGRARGRLRAVVAGHHRDGLMERLQRLPALYMRTRAALQSYAWEWGWCQVKDQFAFGEAHRPTAPCRAPVGPEAPEPLDPAEDAALRCWILLVLLRDRRDHLHRWIETGSTGDHDATWGRLLADALPDTLRDDDAHGGRGRRHERVRAALAGGVGVMLDAAVPALAALAALQGRPPDRIQEEIARWWHPDVPRPQARLGLLPARATIALGELTEVRPCA